MLNSYIYKAGDKSSHIYFIRDGQIEVRTIALFCINYIFS